MTRLVAPAILPYLWASLYVAVAVGFRYLLHPVLGDEYVFSPVLLAVLATAYYFGFRAALAATVLGAFACNFVLMAPMGSFGLAEPEQQIGLLLYLAIGIGVARIAGAMHDAQRAQLEANHTLEAGVRDRTAELTLRNRQLEISEERLRIALQFSNTGGWELNLSDLSAQRTPEHDRIFGYETPLPSWTYGMFLEHVMPEERATVDHLFQGALANGTAWDFECRIRRADGEFRWIWAKGQQERDAEGRPVRMVGIVQDTTERKRNELILKEKERLLRFVTSSARVGLVVIGPDYRYLFANDAYAQLYGLNPGEILGRKLPEVLPTVWPQIQPRLDRGLGGELLEYELVIPALPGASPRYFSVSYEPRRDQAGAPNVHVVVVDITERKQAEMALAERERLLAVVTGTARVGLVIVDQGYRYLFSNEAYAKIFGLETKDLVGHHVPEILPAAWPQIQPKLDQALAGERVVYELTLTPRAGERPRYLAVNYEPRVNDDGTCSVVVVVVDISERKNADRALAERERMFQFVTSSACVGLVVLGSDYRYLFANEAYGRIYGLNVSDIVGRTVPEVIPLAWPQIKPHLDRSLGGTPGGFDLVLPPLPGMEGQRTLAVAYEPHRQEDGSPTSVVVITDVSERKQVAEVAARLSERVTLAARAAGLGIWDWDLIEDKISWDDQMFSLYGRSRGDFGGAYEAWLAGIHPDDRARCNEESQKATNGLIDYESEFRVLWPDGSLHYLKAIGEVFLNEVGVPVRMLGVNLDITKARLAEFATQQQQMRLEGIVNSAMDGIITVDENQHVILMNSAAERMFGASAEESRGTDVERFIPERFRAAHRSHVQEFGKTGVAARAMGRFGPISGLRVSGEEFPIEASISQIEVDGHKLFTVTCRDVTERIRAEEERRKLEAQLHQSQKMEAFGQLAGGVAHDFNNLLTIINGYSEWLLGTMPAGDDSRKHLEEILKAGERAATLTHQLLTFSRQQLIEPKVLKLNAVVDEVESMLRRLIGEDIQLSTVLRPSASFVKVDPGQIEQVVLNLAVNARDAMPQGGQLTIETSDIELDAAYTSVHTDICPGRFNLLAVSDTGVGMSREVRARIFEPFFTTKGLGRGTGLGLAVVHGIVKQSGGNVEVYSEPGKGTTFKIYLPVVAGESADDAAPDASATEGGGETILLVEDEDSLREMTALALTGFGYVVLKACDGREAIQRMADYGGRVDLLLTDVVMPEMSGRSLAETLGRLYPELKVLFISGYTDDAVMRHGVLQSEVAFLQKPFTLEGLSRKIREVIGG